MGRPSSIIAEQRLAHVATLGSHTLLLVNSHPLLCKKASWTHWFSRANVGGMQLGSVIKSLGKEVDAAESVTQKENSGGIFNHASLALDSYSRNFLFIIFFVWPGHWQGLKHPGWWSYPLAKLEKNSIRKQKSNLLFKKFQLCEDLDAKQGLVKDKCCFLPPYV